MLRMRNLFAYWKFNYDRIATAARQPSKGGPEFFNSRLGRLGEETG